MPEESKAREREGEKKGKNCESYYERNLDEMK